MPHFFDNSANATCSILGTPCYCPVAKTISPTTLHHQQFEQLIQSRMDPCFNVNGTKFWPCDLNVRAEIEAHLTRQGPPPSLLLSNFIKKMSVLTSVSCCWITPILSPICFKVYVCVKRFSSAYLDYKEWLFELLLPFYFFLAQTFSPQLEAQRVVCQNPSGSDTLSWPYQCLIAVNCFPLTGWVYIYVNK